ncbi:hypothetical protein PHMEG_00013747 [Phytophthora megakarya]|uniref:Uncharacterized protein n=1 Tax=Phytophthora megakarya TaxID=4795 RepID=A0A225W770_9STRA|nr:hypothetical protein PHMEG_00013747 [Phytophthora megakarya]
MFSQIPLHHTIARPSSTLQRCATTIGGWVVLISMTNCACCAIRCSFQRGSENNMAIMNSFMVYRERQK